MNPLPIFDVILVLNEYRIEKSKIYIVFGSQVLHVWANFSYDEWLGFELHGIQYDMHFLYEEGEEPSIEIYQCDIPIPPNPNWIQNYDKICKVNLQIFSIATNKIRKVEKVKKLCDEIITLLENGEYTLSQNYFSESIEKAQSRLHAAKALLLENSNLTKLKK